MASFVKFIAFVATYSFIQVASAEIREETVRLDKEGVAAIAIHPQNPEVLYYGDRRGRLYRSSDRGVNWAPLNIGNVGFDILDEVSAIIIDPRIPQKVYFQKHNTIYLSTDGGDTGRAIISTGQEHGPLALTLHPAAESVVYVGTDTGLVRTQDGGKLWHNVLRKKVYAVAISTFAPDKIYAVGESVFVSNDGGTTWTETHIEHQDQILGFYAVVVAPHNPEVAYVGVLMKPDVKTPGVLKTVDGGKKWHPAGLDSTAVLELTIDGNDDKVIYAGGGTKIHAGGVYWSQDSGTSWLNVYGWPTVMDLVLDPFSPHVLYVGTIGGMSRYTFETK